MKILEVILTHIVIGVIIFFAVICRSEAREHARILDEPVGTAYDAGSTWIDAQHEGTAGKMIGVDETGWIHVVWTNELVQSLTVRHVFYNLWVPSTGSFLFNVEGGIQVDATVRAANATQTTLPYGACFPAFNFQGIPVSEIYTGAAIDFLPQAGAFMTSSLIPLFETEILYPKIAASGDSTLHIVSTENDAVNPGQPRRIFYSRGTPEYDEFGFGEDINWQNVAGAEQFLTIDTSMAVSADIAASRISQRVAIVWAKSRDDLTENPTDINNDIYLRISENGGITWNPRINITEFLVRDPGCPNETLQCNVDTLRACGDVSIIFDDTDFIHIAFTTRTFFEYGHPGLDSGALTKAGLSGIWHWSEETDSLSPVASAYYPLTAENGAVLLDPGVRQLNVQRPSLAVDETTGYLYCSYQLFDSSQYSVAMYPMADAFVSVSTDGGINWSVGTNITDSAPAVIPAPAGGSMHERDITLADRVSYHNAAGCLHMEYVLDKEAGTAAHEEGVVTNNFVYYHRIPIIDIAASPLVPNYPLHADCELPPAPYELAASENDCDRISLFWMDESDLETMFVISRTPDDTTFFLSAANGIISYIDSTAVPGTEYSYYVAAGNACGFGPSSHVFGIRLSVPEQVTGLTAEGDCDQITLIWQPLAGNVASYLIYRDLIPQPIAT
ncbi:glycoside hydrolase, partial [bacterium]|nr:glycoside hydrolase [bacterium]